MSLAAGCLAILLSLTAKAVAAPETFDTPQAAGAALTAAIQADDPAGLLTVFGSDQADLINGPDPQSAQVQRREIAHVLAQGIHYARTPEGHVWLYFGRMRWPFPVRLTQIGDKWAFDVADGREQVEARRIRVANCVRGMGVDVDRGPHFAAYYGEFDFEYWIRHHLGDELVDWMQQNIHPLDLVFRLAEDYGIVLLNGSGFKGPDWSCRVSFANLDDGVYEDIGRAIRSVARGYLQAFRVSKGLPPLAVTEAARLT